MRLCPGPVACGSCPWLGAVCPILARASQGFPEWPLDVVLCSSWGFYNQTQVVRDLGEAPWGLKPVSPRTCLPCPELGGLVPQTGQIDWRVNRSPLHRSSRPRKPPPFDDVLHRVKELSPLSKRRRRKWLRMGPEGSALGAEVLPLVDGGGANRLT